MTEKEHKKLFKKLKRIPMKSKVYKNEVLIYYKTYNNTDWVISFYDFSALFQLDPMQELRDFLNNIFGGENESI